jgi:hypothetical protein
MPSLSCGNGAFTPATSQDNWTLDSQTAGVVGKLTAIGWGGRLAASTGYRTRWTRPTTIGSSTFTALTSAFAHPNFVTFGARIGTFATAPVLPTDPAGNLWAQDWNGQGGGGALVLPLGQEWYIVNGVLTGQISCRNIAGTDANGSSYELTYFE